MKVGEKIISKAGRRWDRLAPMYDQVMQLVERGQFNQWRSLLWSKVEGKEVLEVGVGTGRNLSCADGMVHNVTAIDLSEGMLKRARQKAAKSRIQVRLLQMDVQELQFQEDTFDTVVGSLVFCSVEDPLRGMWEVKRVCKPGGRVLLLEHGLAENRVLAGFMNVFDPLVAGLTGVEHINRKTDETMKQSGLELENVTVLSRTGIFKLFEARKR